ncbi:squalene/phytoene synthase family protein [Henriciella aquimarina]|uniref:squalene/phytoene synthase family protein n=1 Tax=Henriciella aquimarina TaxID=545261 RepID=UPI001301DF14|nr:squalene/phytoene synthase family protein [Henriciella aquimarina]
MRNGDEDRWLSSRYAPKPERRALIALYAFAWELARVRLVVTEPGLGAIRFQWWRDTLEAFEKGEKPREHEVVGALADMLAEDRYRLDALKRLVDHYEDAFEDADRAQQPEALLTATAAQVLADAHGWGRHIASLAPHVAALRRGEKVGYGPVVPQAPVSIRPAIAHLRLRRIYGKTNEPGNLSKRLCVMRGAMSGKV